VKTYALDTNCFIDAVNETHHSYEALQRIFGAAERGQVSLKVSLHTLHELEGKKDEAWKLAKTLPVLPHWPIGTWADQVATWSELEGTWSDMERNDQIQLQLKEIAKSGTDIRDRGSYIDALCNGSDGFVTSDRQLVGSVPCERINNQFPTKVLTPEQLVEELCR